MIVPHSDTENEDQDNENSSQPLLGLSSTEVANHLDNGNSQLIASTQFSNKKNGVDEKKRRVFIEFKYMKPAQFHRSVLRWHHEKWTRRINIGVLIILSISVVYFCFLVNSTVDKPSSQIVVEVPPTYENILGPKGNRISFFVSS